MNLFVNSVNEPNSICFLATNKFLNLGLYTFTFGVFLDLYYVYLIICKIGQYILVIVHFIGLTILGIFGFALVSQVIKCKKTIKPYIASMKCHGIKILMVNKTIVFGKFFIPNQNITVQDRKSLSEYYIFWTMKFIYIWQCPCHSGLT